MLAASLNVIQNYNCFIRKHGGRLLNTVYTAQVTNTLSFQPVTKYSETFEGDGIYADLPSLE